MFEQQQVRQAAVPSGCRTFDVSGTQRSNVATAPVVPNALHDPCELNLVVGPALVNDGLQPCVAVKWVRNACEGTALVQVLHAPCDVRNIQEFVGDCCTAINKVQCD